MVDGSTDRSLPSLEDHPSKHGNGSKWNREKVVVLWLNSSGARIFIKADIVVRQRSNKINLTHIILSGVIPLFL
jgi:hypothetical protein